MKALIVDNDRISRAVIKRLLSHLNVEVAEADNGLAALQQLELVDPDFLVLDIEMPILSGLEALSAIRQSPLRADVPVICVSASSTKEHVTSMLGLGVADYMLKPINPVDALPRFKTVMLRSTQWRQRREGGSFNTLLLVDADPNFLAFARPLLDQEFEITDISSSTLAAVSFQDAVVKPSLVCMAEGLPLMNEDVLVDVIRKMSIQDGSTPPQIFLLANGDVDAAKASRYAGVVRKSFVPEQFLEEFRRVVLRDQNTYEKLRHLVREGLRKELVTATQQTMGVMMGKEVSTFGEEEQKGIECPTGVCARVTLRDAASGTTLHTELLIGRAQAEKIGSQVLRRESTFEDGGSEVLYELVNTIAGRIRAGLHSRGFDLKMGMPEVVTDEVGEVPADLTAVFRCLEDQVFSLGLRVVKGENDLMGEAQSASPASGATVVAAPVEAAAVQAVDDVLF
jgi:two-component system chemotaxis response regulator CheY